MQSRHFTREVNLNFEYSINPFIKNLRFYQNDVNASNNALLTEIERRFSKSLQVDVQYEWAHAFDDGSSDYYEGNYPYSLRANHGPSDYDVKHNFKVYGVWTPSFINPSHRLLHSVGDGWQVSGILLTHSGYPWTPVYKVPGANLVYSGSGYGTLNAGGFNGGGTRNTDNGTFERANGNFPMGALAYFTIPAYTNFAPPPAPGVNRNSQRGPHYFDMDMSAAKNFALPGSRMLGESQGALAGRVIEFQARVNF